MHPSALNRPIGIFFIVSSLAFCSYVRPRESGAPGAKRIDSPRLGPRFRGGERNGFTWFSSQPEHEQHGGVPLLLELRRILESRLAGPARPRRNRHVLP